LLEARWNERAQQPKPETPQQRWERLYREKNVFRHAMAPAYNAAVAPLLSTIIRHLNKPSIRILVIGGGEGVFSRDLLPAVREKLARTGMPISIRVVETDLTHAVRQAPNSAHRVQADFHRLPFANASFDLIVGQSMMHQGNFLNGLAETKRMLSPDGVFFHVQDDIPLQASAGEHEQSMMRATLQKHLLAATSHIRLLRTFRTQAQAAGFSNAVLAVKSAVLVDKNHSVGKIAGLDLDQGNTVRYENGGISRRDMTDVPAGKKRLVYGGTVTLSSPKPLRPLVEHLKRVLPPQQE
jgi:SAM-dependent methyltransferase